MMRAQNGLGLPPGRVGSCERTILMIHRRSRLKDALRIDGERRIAEAASALLAYLAWHFGDHLYTPLLDFTHCKISPQSLQVKVSGYSGA